MSAQAELIVVKKSTDKDGEFTQLVCLYHDPNKGIGDDAGPFIALPTTTVDAKPMSWTDFSIFTKDDYPEFYRMVETAFQKSKKIRKANFLKGVKMIGVRFLQKLFERHAETSQKTPA